MRILKISKTSVTYRTTLETQDPYNVITVNYYQGTERNLAQYTYMRLLEKSLDQYAYDYLRT